MKVEIPEKKRTWKPTRRGFTCQKSVSTNTFYYPSGTVSNPQAPGAVPPTAPTQRPLDPENPEVQQPETPLDAPSRQIPLEEPANPNSPEPLPSALTIFATKGSPYVPPGHPPKGPISPNPMERLCPWLVPRSSPKDGPPSPWKETPRSSFTVATAEPESEPENMKPGNQSFADADPDPRPSPSVVAEPPTPLDARPAPEVVKDPAPLE